MHTFEADEILLDDLNTPGFIAKIHELYNDARKVIMKKNLKFNQACRLIGLFNVSKKDWENLKKVKLKYFRKFIWKKLKKELTLKIKVIIN